jgi:di/tricarboxylate transporter
VIYLPVALGIVAVAFVAMRIVPLSELYDRIEWPVVVLLGSMIPLGAALETSGGTALIADGLVTLTEGWPAWAILTVLMVVTMTCRTSSTTPPRPSSRRPWRSPWPTACRSTPIRS